MSEGEIVSVPAGGSLWVYLSQTPLLWLTATLAAYLVGLQLYRWSGRQPLANPMFIAVALLMALLFATGTPYATYFQGAQFVHFLLGPVTVSLAVPLFANLAQVRRATLPIVAALVAGAATAVGSAVGIALLLGANGEVLLSLAPKSITTPIAMGIAEQIGGIPSLTAVLVLLTGMIGAVMVTPLFNLLGLTDWRARGFAVGLAAHGRGTARAFSVNELAGTFAGLAMGLNALVTAVAVPLLLPLF